MDVVGKDIERMLTQLPKVSLSTERDRLIRQALASRTLVPEPRMRNWFTIPRLSLALASMLVAVVGVSGYAYASPTVTHGDVLYSTKRAIERVRGSWQRVPLQRVRFHSDLALRRLAELEVLLGERGRAGGVAFVPVAHAQAPGAPPASVNPSAGGAITATAAEVSTETQAAAAAAQQIIEPVVAQQAVQVLTATQAQVTQHLTTAAGTVGTGDAAVVDAIAQAIEAVHQVTTGTAVAAAEVEVAVKRGDREVHVTIVIRREEAKDVTEVQQDLAGQRQELADLQEKLTAAGVPADEITRFFERVRGKLDQVEAAIAAGNLHQAEGLLEAAEALRKNAKHFLKAAERVEEVEEQTRKAEEREREQAAKEIDRERERTAEAEEEDRERSAEARKRDEEEQGRERSTTDAVERGRRGERSESSN